MNKHLKVSYLIYSCIGILLNVIQTAAAQEMQQQTLKEVNVNAKTIILKREADRLIVNVEKSAKASGENVYELLKDLPGVIVTGEDNVSISGKTGISFMIDGKKVMLSGDQLKNMLKNTYSDNIRQIEIIYTPPAKYDAEGAGGMINIVTKKNVEQGYSGTFFTRYSQGKYGSYGAGANLSSRINKVTYLLNMDYYNSAYFSQGTENRRFDTKGIATEFRQQSYDKANASGPSVKAGIDWKINAQHTAGFSVDGNFSRKNNPYTAVTDVATIKTGSIDSSFNTNNQLGNKYSNLNGSLYYTLQLDTSGQSLAFSYDISHFDDRQDLSYRTDFYNNTGKIYRDAAILSGYNPIRINIHVLKLDYTVNKAGYTIETGAKSSFINTCNDIKYASPVNGIMKPDATRSNNFDYHERINAAYLSVKKEWKKFSFQAGLRGEHTNTSGNSITLNNIVSRNYFQLFPSIFLQQQLSPDHTLNLSYSRRITRPDYNSFNPFEFYFDPYSLTRGNPYLNPEFANSFELSYTFRSKYMLSLGYTASTNVISDISHLNDSTKILEYVPVNLDSKHNLSLHLLVPVSISPWWETENSFTLYNNRFNSGLSGTILNRSQTSWKITLNNTFTIDKKTNVQLMGTYTSAYLQDISSFEPAGSISLAIKRYVLNHNGTIKLSATDLFMTDKSRGFIHFDNQDIRFYQFYDSRKLTLTFTLNLRKGTRFSGREKEAGNEEETNRVSIGK
ncbi:outer membrane receptor protein involved in Fe transport [Chitinophaga niastensis]|uniref:Outer membrane receptor protein involved in Fe transport n=1 Tax=Chitinophaga niastensis TaxID=536980 RepID=A0A2P8HEJ6_CHINA|nr:TonB-dependent receptor [Chitinophaga niastensis]PSL44658.1 outer membrane receptor protein involved in Fe transport [Chitinophaga niastensis]